MRLFLVLLCILVIGCTKEKDENCFRRTTDAGWEKLLPEGVCLPNNDYAIDDVILDEDFNQDGVNDLIIKYFNFPKTPGDTVFYEFYLQQKNKYHSLGSFPNISPPILGSTIWGARENSDSLVRQRFQVYPYSLEKNFNDNIIALSQAISQDFGKTHVFVFENDLHTWVLSRIEYWAGEIDPRDVERMELSPDLVGKVILEVLDVSKPLLLKDFDLIASKRRAFGKERDYLELKYDIFEIGR